MVLEIRLADGSVDQFKNTSDIGAMGATRTRHSVNIDSDGNLEVLRWDEHQVFRDAEFMKKWGHEEVSQQIERDRTTQPSRVAYYPSGGWTTYWGRAKGVK
jgi:hypothetical protein